MLTNTVTQQGAGLLPSYVADKLLVVHHDAQLAGPGREHVQRLWEQGELLPRGGRQDNGSPPCLGHAVLASLRTGEPHTGSTGTSDWLNQVSGKPLINPASLLLTNETSPAR